jgi:hypothetical protein
MTKTKDPAEGAGREVAVQEVYPPAPPAPRGTKSGSTEDLKALHADLTAAYREYLEMAKIKPSMLNPAMLGLIQQFLRHNEIAAEAPQQAEMNALEKRLATGVSDNFFLLSERELFDLYQSRLCTANSLGIFIDVTPQDDFSRFTVNVTRRTDGTLAPLVITSLSPEGSVSCSHGGQPVAMGTTQFDRGSFLLTCEKHPLRPISFALDTSQGTSNSVQVPAQTSTVYELQLQNDAFRIRIGQLETSIQNLAQELAGFEGASRAASQRWGEGSQDIRTHTQMVECPTGYYLAG